MNINVGLLYSVRCLLGADGTDIEIKVPTGICIANDAGRLLGICSMMVLY